MNAVVAVSGRDTLADMGLRELREQALLSQRELAARAGVSTKTIVDIEAGRIRPHPATLRKLAHGLDIEPASLADLLRRQPSEQP